jgi:hypothetical protein
MWLAIPVALFIGGIGAVSVFKAVYIDKREFNALASAVTAACRSASSRSQKTR